LVLSSDDGFEHVVDRAPPAVDTGGGLALGLGRPTAAVGVGAVERLVRSPMLIERSNWRWRPDEVPGAIADSRASVAADGGSIYVVLRTGRVVTQTAHHWRTLITSARLSGDAGFMADSIAWDGEDGIVTGHGVAGPAMAYRTADDGRQWSAVAGTSSGAVAALPPCGTIAAPLVPVVKGSGELRVVDPRGRPGAPVEVGEGFVTLGCAGGTILVVDSTGHVVVSTDGGRRWSSGRPAPADLTALVPVGAGVGFATSGGDHPRLWRFTGDAAGVGRPARRTGRQRLRVPVSARWGWSRTMSRS
jgi:hypothetical protein